MAEVCLNRNKNNVKRLQLVPVCNEGRVIRGNENLQGYLLNIIFIGRTFTKTIHLMFWR